MILILVYLVAIVAANLMVAQFGISVTILNAFLFIGLDLSTRDALHEQWQGKQLSLKMAALIGTGSLLSALLNWNAAPIALASFVAFSASGFADTLTYSALGARSRLVKMNGSNLVAAAVDSTVFPAIAFGLSPEILSVIIGQFIAKVLGGFLWSLLLNRQVKPSNVYFN